MKSIKEAHQYLTTTSPKDVFIRVVPYLVLSGSEYKGHKFIKKTPLSILVAALGGPFEFDNLEDPAIKELLTITDYGHRADWGDRIVLWAQKYVNANEVIYYNEILQMIMNIENPVADYLGENARYNQQPKEYYLHELQPFGTQRWPRI
jgi:hypothetical protein